MNQSHFEGKQMKFLWAVLIIIGYFAVFAYVSQFDQPTIIEETK